MHAHHPEAVQAGGAGGAVQGPDQVASVEQLPGEGAAPSDLRVAVSRPTSTPGLKQTATPAARASRAKSAHYTPIGDGERPPAPETWAGEAWCGMAGGGL